MFLYLAVILPIAYVMIGMVFAFAIIDGQLDRAALGITIIWPLFVIKLLMRVPKFVGTSLAGGIRELREY